MTLKNLLPCIEINNRIKIFIQNADGTSRHICTYKDACLALGYLPERLLNSIVLNISGDNKTVSIYLDDEAE